LPSTTKFSMPLARTPPPSTPPSSVVPRRVSCHPWLPRGKLRTFNVVNVGVLATLRKDIKLSAL
jgi:hypothetical protein